MKNKKVVDLPHKFSKKEKNKSKLFIKFLHYSSLSIFLIGIGILASSLYWKYFILSNKEKIEEIHDNFESLKEENETPYLGDGPITSPLNGIELTESEYEDLSNNIPHAVMISNNASARSEQYGLNNADIVYEAEVEGAITRFMGIFWSNQENYIIKPVRSVRKYFLDWALEYGNIPVSFTGFAQTNNPDTNAWGLYQEEDIRITYWDWPFKWDDECLSNHPSMHCKRATPEDLYTIFDSHEWTFDSWEGFINQNEWEFSENLDREDYPSVEKVTYSFGWDDRWSTKWIYNKERNVYEKYEPDDQHIDMNDNNIISASTVIIQVMDREYTGDSEGRVAYKTVGFGDVYVMRDGKKIFGSWSKKRRGYRTNLFHMKLYKYDIDQNIPLKPGLVWIAVVPSDQEIIFE